MNEGIPRNFSCWLKTKVFVTKTKKNIKNLSKNSKNKHKQNAVKIHFSKKRHATKMHVLKKAFLLRLFNVLLCDFTAVFN